MSAEKRGIAEKAEIAVENFIKEHYDAEFVLQEFEIVDPAIQSTIYIYGYVKGHENEKITVVYSYRTNEVRNVIGPDWFIDNEINE